MMTMRRAYSEIRPRRDWSRLPTHSTLPRSRRMEVCACVSSNKRRAFSTVAFLLAAPLRRIAWRIRRSSISMFVRTMYSSRCVNISHFCVWFNKGSQPDGRRQECCSPLPRHPNTALQGCYSQGERYEQAVENIKDAIRLHVEDRLADGEEIPQHVSVSLSMVEVAV